MQLAVAGGTLLGTFLSEKVSFSSNTNMFTFTTHKKNKKKEKRSSSSQKW